jgi:hypothetical protein
VPPLLSAELFVGSAESGSVRERSRRALSWAAQRRASLDQLDGAGVGVKDQTGDGQVVGYQWVRGERVDVYANGCMRFCHALAVELIGEPLLAEQ